MEKVGESPRGGALVLASLITMASHFRAYLIRDPPGSRSHPVSSCSFTFFNPWRRPCQKASRMFLLRV